MKLVRYVSANLFWGIHMMQDATLTVKLNTDDLSATSTCVDYGNENLQQVTFASFNEVVTELSRVLSKDRQLRYRLVFYALKNIRLYFSADSMNSLTAQDVVQIVLEKILTGARKWNKKLIPDIKVLLFLSIKSFIRNEKRRTKNIAAMDIDTLKSEINSFSFNNFCSELLHRDFNQDIFSTDFKFLISKLKMMLKEDIYASFVLDEILDGADSNIEIAKSLNITVNDVENAKKRIRNKSVKLINNSG